jgi:hypothetical protein
MSLTPAVTATPVAPETAAAPQGRSGWLLVVVAATACIGISLASGTHVGLVLILIPIVVALSWQSPRTMIAIMPVWMVMLGLVRRLTPGGGNVTFSGDPVLIIGPLVLILLFVVAASRGATKNRSRLASVIGALSILALVEAVNPKQHSFFTGLGGLLFILVPMLAFWIGRALVDEDLALQLVKTVAILSFFAAIYGLIQQFHGLPSWDARWTATRGYSALNLGQNVIRAFGTFSSAQEYAAFLSVGLIAWVSLAGKATRMLGGLHFAGLATVATALWFESERTAVFLTCLAIGVMFAARIKLPSIGVIIGGVGAIALLMFVGGHFGSGGGGSTASTLTAHQITGISSPFSSGSSLPGHIRATKIGIRQGISSPLGHGTGTVTIASNRYGKSKTVGTEFDPGNMGIAFGILGLLFYVLLVFYAIRTTYRSAVTRHDAIAFFGLGMLMATLFQWTNGDLYSVCWLIWLFLGFLDMAMLKRQRDAAAGLLVVPVAPAVESPTNSWRKPGESRRWDTGA